MPKSTTIRKLTFPITLAIVGTALGLISAFSDFIFLKDSNNLAPLSDCDLQKTACITRFPNSSQVQVELLPRPIKTMGKLLAKVQLNGIQAEKVELDFAGFDMEMGFNRFALTQQTDGSYQGRVILPVCVRERMIWEAKVMLHTPDGLLSAPFHFQTEER